jgi:DNA-binding LacI/PurR family transcriptional regulator
MKKTPTLRDVAKEAGVCVATVSMALRNRPNIPETTRQRIREVADSMGYRPNPRVAELMGQIRKNRTAGGLTETVALLWTDLDRASVHDRSYRLEFEKAIQARLLENGYGLDVWYHDPSLRMERLEAVLRSRGIRGVILAPLFQQNQASLEWDWSHFSTVITGSANWVQEFNRVRFNNFRDMRALVRCMVDQGIQRPGLVTNQDLEDRSQHSIDGGFWSALPREIRREDSIYETDVRGEDGFLDWVMSYRPDGVILGPNRYIDLLQTLPDPPSIYLRNVPDPSGAGPYPGLRQDYSRLGNVAAEQLMAQLQLNQCGVPSEPTQTLITGKVVTPVSPSV